MIRAVTDIIDNIKDKVEGMPSFKKTAIDSIKKEFEEVESLLLTEGAAIDINRVVAQVRRQVLVPVSGEEEVIQKEVIGQLRVLGIVATAFKQYFETQRR